MSWADARGNIAVVAAIQAIQSKGLTIQAIPHSAFSRESSEKILEAAARSPSDAALLRIRQWPMTGHRRSDALERPTHNQSAMRMLVRSLLEEFDQC
jgi:hypothetical protein